VLYIGLAKLTDAPLFLLVLIIVLTVAHRLLDRNAAPMWADFLMKDAAYGWVQETGIEYHLFFRSHFAEWSQIQRIEHFADNGRTKIFLVGKTRPVQFGPSNVSGLDSFLKKNKAHYSDGNFIEYGVERKSTI